MGIAPRRRSYRVDVRERELRRVMLDRMRSPVHRSGCGHATSSASAGERQTLPKRSTARQHCAQLSPGGPRSSGDPELLRDSRADGAAQSSEGDTRVILSGSDAVERTGKRRRGEQVTSGGEIIAKVEVRPEMTRKPLTESVLDLLLRRTRRQPRRKAVQLRPDDVARSAVQVEVALTTDRSASTAPSPSVLDRPTISPAVGRGELREPSRHDVVGVEEHDVIRVTADGREEPDDQFGAFVQQHGGHPGDRRPHVGGWREVHLDPCRPRRQHHRALVAHNPQRPVTGGLAGDRRGRILEQLLHPGVVGAVLRMTKRSDERKHAVTVVPCSGQFDP
jgi:hypothetical protein